MSIERIETRFGHSYTIDGEPADGVTTLIGKGIPKPALLKWAPRMVAEYVADNLDQVGEWQNMGRWPLVNHLKETPWLVRDAAAKRGTEVHALAEKLTHGLQVGVPEELKGHVDACVGFLDAWQVRPVVTEVVVASRQWRYCGTLDGVADVAGGRRVLYDWKTARSGIYGETALQLAAYTHAEVYLDAGGHEQPVSELGIQGALGVWLKADGTFSAYELDVSEQTFKIFLHAAYTGRHVDRLRDLKSDALGVPQ